MNRFVAPEVLDDEYTCNLYEQEDLTQIPSCRKIAMIQALNSRDARNKAILDDCAAAKSALEGMREAFDKMMEAL